SSDAIKAANLNWKVTKLPLYGTNGILGVPVKGKYAVVREDKIGKQDASVFGIVGEGYTPLQNEEAFTFFDTLVAEKNAAIYHTAGALGNGERIWILAKLPSNIIVRGDDIVNKYLLLSNNHNGKAGVQIKFTPIRVVCNNTLTAALAYGTTLSIPHYRDVHARLQQAERMLGIINFRFGEIEESFKQMARVQMNEYRVDKYLNEVFPDPLDPSKGVNLKKAADNRSLAKHLFAEGKGNKMPGVAGTLWAAYNGVTELIDHRLSGFSKRTDNTNDSRRLNSIWFGQGSAVKSRAFTVAMEKSVVWTN
ncbi:MAG: DUF932 domain-containing protein, partial [Pyrinomonadaceae bacterium]